MEKITIKREAGVGGASSGHSNQHSSHGGAGAGQSHGHNQVNNNNNNSGKPMPKDASVIISLLREAGIEKYEPRVVTQLLEFVHKHVSTVLEEARCVANHAKKKNIDCEDVKLASTLLSDRGQCSPPPREMLLELARSRNVCPLPLVKPHCGLRLPPDRYCLSSCNYKLARTPSIADNNLRRVTVPIGQRNIQTIQQAQVKRQSLAGAIGKSQPVPKPVFKFSTGGKPPPKSEDKMDIDSDGQMLKRKRDDDDYDAL